MTTNLAIVEVFHSLCLSHLGEKTEAIYTKFSTENVTMHVVVERGFRFNYIRFHQGEEESGIV